MASAAALQNARSLSFSEWFERWGPDLWAIVHFGAPRGDEYRDEFLDVLGVARGRIARALLRQSEEAAARIFFQEWLRRQAKRRALSRISGEPDWETKLLLCGLFQRSWSLPRAAVVAAMAPAALRFRCFQALKISAHIEGGAAFPYRDRDCVRHDLYFIDLLLNLSWPDPLQLNGPDEMRLHQKECPRCLALSRKLSENAQVLRRSPSLAMPEDVWEWVRSEVSPRADRSGISGPWGLPWFLKSPLQVASMLVLGAAVLSVPYVGDYFPRVLQPLGEFWRKQPWSHSLSPAPAVVKSTVESVPTPKVAATTEPPKTSAAPAVTPTLERPEVFDTQVRAWALNLSPVVPEAPGPLELPRGQEITLPPAASVPVAVATPKAPVLPAPPVEAKVAVAPPPAVPAPAPVVVEEKAAPEKAPAQVAAQTAAPAAATGQKYFYRWGAFSTKLDADTVRIKDIIARHNAILAGELELGAHYRGGRYFHFTVPAADYEKLLKEIQALNLENFTNARATSDRETAAGQNRIVFLIKGLHSAP